MISHMVKPTSDIHGKSYIEHSFRRFMFLVMCGTLICVHTFTCPLGVVV